jgi:uncharacterized protein YecT (DUF1311 family)
MKLKLPLVCAMAIAALTFPPCSRGADDADAEQKDPIDKQVERMMDKDPSTAGTVRALEEGAKLWDRELNKAYSKLMDALPARGQETLKQAQRSWLACRDAEKPLASYIYERAQGTMYIPVPVSNRMEFIKARTIRLRAYLEALESSGEKTD